MAYPDAENLNGKLVAAMNEAAAYFGVTPATITNYCQRLHITRRMDPNHLYGRIYADMVGHRALEAGHPLLSEGGAPPPPADEEAPAGNPASSRESINARALEALRNNLSSLIAMTKGTLPPKMRLDATKAIMDIYKATSSKEDRKSDEPDSWSAVLRSLDQEETKVA